MDKEKKINTTRAVFTMKCLKFVLEDINILGFLHLDMEGWETYALRGDVVALRGIDDTCCVVCVVWYERDMKRRHISLRYADGFRPPCNDILASMVEHPNFEWIDYIADQDRNLCFLFRGEEYWGEGR